ncbi:MAG: metal-dependent hydrolase [Halanaerobiales bacterium]|nr:metal-dependent hydrolase [Halanaerobiales bacterium]
MMGKTHMMIGTSVGVVTAMNCPIEAGLIIIGCSIFGALIPDIDHPKSKLNQKILPINNKFFRVLIYLIIGFGFLYQSTKLNNRLSIILGVTLIITGLSHHRGFTHSLLGLLCFSSVVYLIVMKYNIPEMYIGFFMGYVSHLVADFMTMGGIKFFYPWNKKLSFPLSIKTGGIMEELIFLVAGIYTTYNFVKYMTMVPK